MKRREKKKLRNIGRKFPKMSWIRKKKKKSQIVYLLTHLSEQIFKYFYLPSINVCLFSRSLNFYFFFLLIYLSLLPKKKRQKRDLRSIILFEAYEWFSVVRKIRVGNIWAMECEWWKKKILYLLINFFMIFNFSLLLMKIIRQ